ncbi:hypothetical protein OPT61_g8798 [Boeremia exigua]|uniref:Uncharacterized protein n=1 Tax=Boeremia exigua TaxID=749465 RepID=A0ACC2HXT0_9PLEO|nr:hypothetical protein OPT61_g8798 [Boeremia exigua]
MKFSALAVAQAGLLNVLPATAEYVWPSKHDRTEDMLVMQGGYIREGFVDGISPCTRNNSPGRQTAAEWIRTAFHDMATFDKATGTGGLDASIQFETDRAENAGDAFNGTFGFTNNYFNVRTSAADLIALSTVLAVGNCGGPKIPLRLGRVDATEAGALGVPEPQQDLDTHKTMFAKAGFSTEDMIAMVACGHTMGGVHGKTFPEITENNTESNVVHFDSTDATFDPKVATEYLDGTTQNPLVVAHNDTLNSDKRIFAADNNVTMKALASDPETFQSMCADIFARMLDTVPSTVTLTEPIEPIPLKPYITSFALTNVTHITFTGRIRLLTESGLYDDQRVSLTYTPRFAPAANVTLNTTISTRPASFKLGLTNGIFGELFKWHEFSVALPTSTSIKSFNVTVTRVSTGEQTFYDNAGHSYPMDDTVLYQDAQSCRDANDATIVAAVRKSVIDAGTPVVASVARKYSKQGTIVPAIEMEEWKGEVGKEVGDFVFVTIKGVQQPRSYSTNFDLVAGEHRVEFLQTNVLGQKQFNRWCLDIEAMGYAFTFVILYVYQSLTAATFTFATPNTQHPPPSTAVHHSITNLQVAALRSDLRYDVGTLSSSSQQCGNLCPDWIFSDSSNVHVAKDKAWFTSYHAFDSMVSSVYGIDTSTPVLGIGTVKLTVMATPGSFTTYATSVIEINNVLHVPDYICNILGRPLTDAYQVNLGGSVREGGPPSRGGISLQGKQIAYFQPGPITFFSLAVMPPHGMEFGPSVFENKISDVASCHWPNEERARWQALVDEEERKYALDEPPYTLAETEYVFDHWGTEFRLLAEYRLKLSDEKDRSEGRRIVRALMDGRHPDDKVEKEYDIEGKLGDYLLPDFGLTPRDPRPACAPRLPFF